MERQDKKRHFLMLADVRHIQKDKLLTLKTRSLAGWFASIKYDGIRCWWDGGISTGVPASEVPWANTSKHARLKDTVIATGLWTRYAQPIRAPKEWIDLLPRIPLDGELWCGIGNNQLLNSIVKSFDAPSYLWSKVKFGIFDSPDYKQVLSTGVIEMSMMNKTLIGCDDWAYARSKELGLYEAHMHTGAALISMYPWLRGRLTKHLAENENNPIFLVEQVQLPNQTERAELALEKMFLETQEKGHEGLMVRDPLSRWVPWRTNRMLKVKPDHDLEGKLVGFTFGKEGKYLGMMGSLRVRLDNGKDLDVSGFTDDEREIIRVEDQEFAKTHPGELAPKNMALKCFILGDIITIKYRELTLDGLPKEARYLRTRLPASRGSDLWT